MRLIGIQIINKEPSISKILNSEWYPFGSYEAPKDDNGVELPERDEVKDSVYQFPGLPYITVNCIVGKNGAGKSTLLDIMYRIVNNFTCKLLGKERIDNQHGRTIVYARGVYAKLFYEIDGNQYLIQCEDEIVTFCCKKKGQDFMHNISFEGIENPKNVLTEFFYTIITNYSIYSLNECDYQAQNESDIEKGINGSWLQGLFHKNDGYLTPIVITPFRCEGSIVVPRENNLAKQRIVVLSLLSKSQKTSFFEGYAPAELIFEIDNYYQTRIREGYMTEIDKKYPGLSSQLVIEAFTEAWEGFLTAKYGTNLNEAYIDQYNAALFYLGYKSFKICMMYDDFWKEFDVTDMITECAPKKNEKAVDTTKRFIQYVRKEVPKKVKSVIKKIEEEIDKPEKSHITLKIEVCLGYILPILKGEEPLWPNSGKYPVETFVEGKTLETYNDAVMILPPPFFNYDIKFIRNEDRRPIDSSWGEFYELEDFTISQMSSGERQMLNMISYVLYHIKNIQSIRDDDYRVNYHHVCLVFDEAELYFHPDYQRKFMSMLLESLQWCHIDNNVIKSIQILVVTHSPFVLSDMFRDNMLYLKDGSRANMPQNEIFGANLYQLMTESFFFDESAMGRVASKQISEWIKRVNEHGGIGVNEIELIGDPIIKSYIMRKRAENRRNYV